MINQGVHTYPLSKCLVVLVQMTLIRRVVQRQPVEELVLTGRFKVKAKVRSEKRKINLSFPAPVSLVKVRYVCCVCLART